jgi:hypothetical protein
MTDRGRRHYQTGPRCTRCNMPETCHTPDCRLAGASSMDSHPKVCREFQSDKPQDYHARRRWQDAARASGEDPECGRGACRNKAEPAWVNAGTPLLYCEVCAGLINGFNPGLCSPEFPEVPEPVEPKAP